MPSILFDDTSNNAYKKKNGETVYGSGYKPYQGTIYQPGQNNNGAYYNLTNPTKPRPDGGGGGGGVSASDIQNTYNDELIAARDAELAALEARLQSSIDLYNQQLNQIKANYEGLRDQSELDRFKSRRALREALANRGQLDSGYGRQEALNTDLGYSSQLNAINMQEEQANQEVQNKINELKANNLADKANIRARYAEALRQ